MWGTFLSEPLSIVGLVGRYPANCLMERMPIYQRWIFNKYSHAGPLFYGVLIRLSPGYPPLIGKLHTRYSPVRRSPSICIATNHAAPRLACVKPVASVHPEPGSNSSLFKLFYVFAQDSVILSGSSIFDGIHSKYLYYCCICKFLKELFSIVSCETWCKGKDFYFYLPNFFEVFFRFIFFRKFFRNDFRTFAWIFQPHPSVYLFPDSLALFHHVTTASLSIADAKVLLYNI